MDWSRFEQSLVSATERYLTWRKRRKLVRKEKQKRKNQVQDWAEAILWAMAVVLLVNQLLLQAYAIPSQSMEDTLKIEDRLFVDKMTYGPELLPGLGRLPIGQTPVRGDIIVFVNPDYRKEMGRAVTGAEEIFHRIVYMATFSLVNLDVKPDGQPAHHFLVKRLVGMPGDRIRFRDGRAEIRTPGDTFWQSDEALLSNKPGIRPHFIKKLFEYGKYAWLKNYFYGRALKSMALPAGSGFARAETELKKEFANIDEAIKRNDSLVDKTYEDYWYSRAVYEVSPFSDSIRYLARKKDLGYYIPQTRFFPMGDNRDNSRDARYYDPVPFSNLLGKAAVRFWPLTRMGGVN